MTSRVDGSDGALILGGTTYYFKGDATLNLHARRFAARATGDAAPVTKTGSGLSNDSSVQVTGVMVADWTTLQALDGTESVVTVMEGSTSVFQCTCNIEVTTKAPAEDMGTVNITLVPQAAPTIPTMSGI